MNTSNLPDVARHSHAQGIALDWVGMERIAVPILIGGERLCALANAGVSLDDAQAKGIHMSRLYLALEALQQQELSPGLLQQVLTQFLASHRELSQQASLRLETQLLFKRPALISPLAGWKQYPAFVQAHLDQQGLQLELGVEITYSSTCPCSAALARQLIQQRFSQRFNHGQAATQEVLEWLGSTDGIVATPHSQRSHATLQVRLDSRQSQLPWLRLIEQAEAALGTAVQTAVKRADEQAFALANGQNLMFCEDAARRLHLALRQLDSLQGFQIHIVHAESLHAHDAVARSSWRWS